MTIDAIMEQARELAVPDRAELVALLLDSLEDAEPDEAWRAVIDRRRTDGAEPVDACEVIAKARAAVAAAMERGKRCLP